MELCGLCPFHLNHVAIGCRIKLCHVILDSVVLLVAEYVDGAISEVGASIILN